MATAKYSPVSFQRNRVSAVTNNSALDLSSRWLFDVVSQSEVRSRFAGRGTSRFRMGSRSTCWAAFFLWCADGDTRGDFSFARAWAWAGGRRCTPIT